MLNFPQFPAQAFDRLLPWAFEEDEGSGDITSLATLAKTLQGSAKIICKADGVVAGLPLVQRVIKYRKLSVQVNQLVPEGAVVSAGTVIMILEGSVQALLICERIILNFLQRLSGIATTTHAFVEVVKGSNTHILDTRKTLPVYRELDKYAVAIGGGKNHRMGLYDMVLVKDNHADACGSVRTAVEKSHTLYGEKYVIEAEVRSLAELETLLDGPVNILLLDNMDDETLSAAIARVRARAPHLKIEASGNMDMDRVKRLRLLNEGRGLDLDFISVGALTHSVKALDLSMKIENISDQKVFVTPGEQ